MRDFFHLAWSFVRFNPHLITNKRFDQPYFDRDNRDRCEKGRVVCNLMDLPAVELRRREKSSKGRLRAQAKRTKMPLMAVVCVQG